jgi:hypothetical protein
LDLFIFSRRVEILAGWSTCHLQPLLHIGHYFTADQTQTHFLQNILRNLKVTNLSMFAIPAYWLCMLPHNYAIIRKADNGRWDNSNPRSTN